MPFGARPFDLLIILVVALLIFGPKKLPEMGAAIGKSVTAFKKGIKEATDDKETGDAVLLLEQQKLDAKRLELEALEREIASKQATLNVHEASQTVESTNTEMQAN
jgi:sec-independent protein translocase protein TatA